MRKNKESIRRINPIVNAGVMLAHLQKYKNSCAGVG